jgi:type III pantothenate kinase
MLLAIDAGNTNIVFALHDGKEIIHKWRISSADSRTADEYMVWLSQLLNFEKLDVSIITGAIIATVVPQTLFPLQLLCRRYFKCDALVVGSQSVNLDVKVNLPNPEEVGSDRLVNAVAAHEKYGGPMIIIDFGTATTFDVIDSVGNYHGGVIAPGVNLSLEALSKATATLPRVAVENPNKVIGNNTITAIQSGIFYGYLSMIEGMVERISDEFGGSMKVLATGGLAPLFNEASNIIQYVDQELTTYGLFKIYTANIENIDV